MAPLKFFRIHICQPINSSSLAGDFDWRDATYDIKDVSIDNIDLSKKYQAFVESFTLRQYTNMTGAGVSIDLAYCIESPSFVDQQAFHSKEVDDTGVVLLHGHITDYSRSVQTSDIGTPVSLDFLRRRQIRIRLTPLVGGAFGAEVSPDAYNGDTNMKDFTFYRLTLLFTQMPEPLQS